MSGLNQKTIKKNIELSGIGLHSGNIVKIRIKPAMPNTGILFKRTDLTKERFTSKIDANGPNNIQVFTKTYNKKNAYSSFDVLNKNFPEKQFYATVVPDYVSLNYDVLISTYFVEQNNKIIEAMNYASDSYWGDPERFKFKAIINSYHCCK